MTGEEIQIRPFQPNDQPLVKQLILDGLGPVVRDIAPGVLQADAANGYAPLAIKAAHAPFVEKVRRQGIAALGIVNTYHYAALWPEVEALTEESLVAFAFVNGRSNMAPSGGIRPLFGTDPMAFGWPRRNAPN